MNPPIGRAYLEAHYLGHFLGLVDGFDADETLSADWMRAQLQDVRDAWTAARHIADVRDDRAVVCSRCSAP